MKPLSAEEQLPFWKDSTDTWLNLASQLVRERLLRDRRYLPQFLFDYGDRR